MLYEKVSLRVINHHLFESKTTCFGVMMVYDAFLKNLTCHLDRTE